MVMVITLLPVLIIKFLHLLIAVISCVKSSLLNQYYLKLVVYTTYCPHLAMNPQLKNYAITHNSYRKKPELPDFIAPSSCVLSEISIDNIFR